MSNVVSDNLHKLIKSMSKPEKRYFKVFSSRHIIGENNNYQILFDAIDKQDVYNEEKLLKKFKDEGFVNRFSISKNRLYTAILRSLDSFHSNSSIQAQLHRQLHSVEILYQKSLYDQSLKLLHSARKVAEKHEKLTILAEIYSWEKRILEKNNYEEPDNTDQIAGMLRADRELSNTLQTYNELWNIKSRIFSLLYKQGKVRSSAELAEMKDIIDELKGKSFDPGLSSENQYLLNHILSAYHFGAGEYEACYPFLKQNLALLEEKEHLFQDEPNIYISVLTNAIHVGMRLGKFDNVRNRIELLNQLPARLEDRWNDDLQIRVFALSRSTELTMYAQIGDFEKGLALIPEIESGMQRYGEHLSSVRKAHFYFNMAIIYFGLDRFKDALRSINALLNNIEIDKTRDIHCIAQILNLVIHLELGNKDLLPYSLRSTQRFLETRNRVYKFESVMLNFINDMVKKRMDRSTEQLFGELEMSLRDLKSDHFERTVFEYFDFHAWAKGKLEGKKYRDTLAA